MRKIFLATMGWILLNSCVQAGVIVESSRVIFSAADRERSLLLSNTNTYPVIVQTWVDDGDPDGTPETAGDVPVMPLPGIFRLEAGEQKNLRLLATQIRQPEGRESLYWLNIYEVPPTDLHLPPGLSAVKVAVRLQLKLFYRPQHLEPDIDSLSARQKFSVNRQPGISKVKIENPTPYFATFSTARLSGKGRSQNIRIGMLAPFSAKTVDIEGGTMWQPETIEYQLINDDGNGVTGRKALR